MAHNIDMTTGKAAFTWLQGTALPWHNLGQPTPEDSELDVWALNGGFGFQVVKRDVGFLLPPVGEIAAPQFEIIPDMACLVRSDTGAPLSIQSKVRYHIHQPREVLDFFSKWINENKLRMETCGVLRGGRVVFALAKLDEQFSVNIGNVDKVESYLLLTTSFDGSIATSAIVTSIRVVCANTHGAAMNEGERTGKMFRQKHTSMFDTRGLQFALESASGELAYRAKLFNAMADKAMTADDINTYLIQDVLEIEPEHLNRFDDQGKPLVSAKSQSLIKLLQNSYTNAPGANLAKGTAWGAYNAVTHFVDHAARTRDNNGDGADLSRLASAWYGAGAQLKKRALDKLLERTEIKVAA